MLYPRASSKDKCTFGRGGGNGVAAVDELGCSHRRTRVHVRYTQIMLLPGNMEIASGVAYTKVHLWLNKSALIATIKRKLEALPRRQACLTWHPAAGPEDEQAATAGWMA